MKRVLLALVFMVLASCSAMDASGPKFIKHNSLSPEGALVYLFKPESASKDGVTACLTLTLNGTEYGCVQGKGYIVAEIEPGVYSAALVNKASFGFKLLEFPLELKAGEIVYLEYAYDRELSGELLDKSFASLGPFFSGNHVVAKINEPDALLKLDTLHLSR